MMKQTIQKRNPSKEQTLAFIRTYALQKTDLDLLILTHLVDQPMTRKEIQNLYEDIKPADFIRAVHRLKTQGIVHVIGIRDRGHLLEPVESLMKKLIVMFEEMEDC